MGEEKKYKIIRFIRSGAQRVIRRNLSLEEAQKHCSLESTHLLDKNSVPIWFDGYTEQ